jgi:hypothetical protein
MRSCNFWPLLLLLSAACKKNSVSNTSSGEVFPNKVGDRWQYLVKDTTIKGGVDSGAVQYNLDVVIVDTVKWSNGVVATLWQFSSPAGSDTNFVFQTGDTVRFMDKTNSYVVRQYLIPFNLRASWFYANGIFEVNVTGQADLTVGGYNFKNVYEIYGNAGIPDAKLGINEWFADHIGLVKRFFNSDGELIFTRHNQEWSLVSYKLK